MTHVLLDAHVHCYPEFPMDKALLAAVTNLRQLESALGEADHWALLITATARERDWRERCAKAVQSLGGSHKEDGGALVIEGLPGQDKALWLIPGRQYRCAGNIEVLAGFAGLDFDDDDSLPDLLQQLDQAGAVAILPWGVGKWLGRRGRAVREAIMNAPPGLAMFVGDNGGRPLGWPRGTIFSAARKHGVYNLPGSDPLYIGSEYKKIGTSGALIPLADQQAGMQALKQSLEGLEAAPVSVTKRVGWIELLAAQLAMRSAATSG